MICQSGCACISSQKSGFGGGTELNGEFQSVGAGIWLQVSDFTWFKSPPKVCGFPGKFATQSLFLVIVMTACRAAGHREPRPNVHRVLAVHLHGLHFPPQGLHPDAQKVRPWLGIEERRQLRECRSRRECRSSPSAAARVLVRRHRSTTVVAR